MYISLLYMEKVCCDNCELIRKTGRRWKEESTGTLGKLRNGQLNKIFFIAAPCILIFTQFIHQQMHIY